MVAGDVVQRQGAQPDAGRELGVGEAVTISGRISVARTHVVSRPKLPFSAGQLASLDEALTLGSRETGLDFSVYLGELGEDTRQRAEQLHAAMGQAASNAVLVAVSPGQRAVEVVTGEESHRRLSDRGCKLAVMSMVASFREGDLIGGLVSGLRMLADQAGPAPRS
ncbi:DUF5130 family protein [Goodfellowiella coeruleoviolacea]|uniref:TLP18.3, Psb32 and MOLO-1 founding protein of phosphatase n=1 Tax=Goodfellowiella coeruleoviolacea TaxID=334858 RepID=A0AAE3GB72_9PSEU|nr:DUF5130 family protein [Goodfellowiella coeruleoviolacea]MCP2165077.1 TLP18.3, Psb32 and MOLO-1 founding protein of phosphatase [Goodfellowiella coeruleoviolacea]